MNTDPTIFVMQVLTVSSSVPPKVSAALSAAEEARCSLQDLVQKEQFISIKLKQVGTSSDSKEGKKNNSL